jgi:hypothetical protein
LLHRYSDRITDIIFVTSMFPINKRHYLCYIDISDRIADIYLRYSCLCDRMLVSSLYLFSTRILDIIISHVIMSGSRIATQRQLQNSQEGPFSKKCDISHSHSSRGLAMGALTCGCGSRPDWDEQTSRSVR